MRAAKDKPLLAVRLGTDPDGPHELLTTRRKYVTVTIQPNTKAIPWQGTK